MKCISNLVIISYFTSKKIEHGVKNVIGIFQSLTRPITQNLYFLINNTKFYQSLPIFV